MERRLLRKGAVSLIIIIHFHFFITLFYLHNIMQVWAIVIFPTLYKETEAQKS